MPIIPTYEVFEDTITGLLPAEYASVFAGLCDRGLGLKCDLKIANTVFRMVSFTIEDADPTSVTAIEGFLSGLDAIRIERQAA